MLPRVNKHLFDLSPVIIAYAPRDCGCLNELRACANDCNDLHAKDPVKARTIES
ncbi:hypothetical protein SDC9_201465 [bioreactor metagenome]|uniref:Uncharacterized protein n=1 Tax=bioreactor metagenome TaxID=1076179 RepID=A0A645ITS3_9ZZZZ